jgi:hypothetical protein
VPVPEVDQEQHAEPERRIERFFVTEEVTAEVSGLG